MSIRIFFKNIYILNAPLEDIQNWNVENNYTFAAKCISLKFKLILFIPCFVKKQSSQVDLMILKLALLGCIKAYLRLYKARLFFTGAVLILNASFMFWKVLGGFEHLSTQPRPAVITLHTSQSQQRRNAFIFKRIECKAATGGKPQRTCPRRRYKNL